MIRHVEQKSVSQVLPDDKIIYKIPKYQRKYTWGQNEWDLLFNDVIENDEGYFLGSTICVALPGSAFGATYLEVIDGQQRMTSLSILLSVLYTKLLKHKDELDIDSMTDLNNIKRQLAYKQDDKYVPRLQLQIQDNNQADYNFLLYESGIIENAEELKQKLLNISFNKSNKYSSPLSLIAFLSLLFQLANNIFTLLGLYFLLLFFLSILDGVGVTSILSSFIPYFINNFLCCGNSTKTFFKFLYFFKCFTYFSVGLLYIDIYIGLPVLLNSNRFHKHGSSSKI